MGKFNETFSINNLNSIITIDNKISSLIDSIYNSISEINNDLKVLSNANGKDSELSKTVHSKRYYDGHWLEITSKIEKKWNITGEDEVIANVNNMTEILKNVESLLSNLNIKTFESEYIVELIGTYNNSIEAILAAGVAIPEEFLSKVYMATELSKRVTSDEFRADNGDWDGVKDENIKWWIDKPLKFKKDPNNLGTNAWLIYQQDENDNWIGMGFTDEKTVLEYTKIFGVSLEKETNNKDISAINELITANLSVDLINTLENNNEIEENINQQEDINNINLINNTVMNNVLITTSADKIINAETLYADEIENAKKCTKTDNMFATTTEIDDENGHYYLTHVVVKNPNQIVVANANGSYGNGKETTSSMAKKASATIAVNGSHFVDDGSQDIYNTGTLKIAINNGEIKEDYGASLGMEICIDKNGNIFSPEPGTTAQELIDMGVTNTFSSHDVPLIINGEIQNGNGTQEWNEALNKSYNRTIIAMKEPGEYYILTGETTNLAAAQILHEKGVEYAKSLDQGGSTTLVYDNDLVNKPTDNTGEREVGDMIGFKI